jgi:AsmA protein
MAEPAGQVGTAPPRRRGLRIAGIVVLAVLVLVIGGGAILIASFDPNTLKPRIVEAVRQATGRDIALNGDIGLKWSLQPTIAVRDVAISNPPGFSRPHMATLQELDLRLALFPLLQKRVEIDRLVLLHPDVRLETNAQGQPNWHFTPERPEAAPAPQAANQERKGQGMTIGVQDVRIDNGVLSYFDSRHNQTTTLDIQSLNAVASSQDAPLHLTSQASYNGTPFTLTADTGPLSRLQDRAASTPWPVKAALQGAGAQLAADGSITRPTEGKGYDLAVNASVPDLSTISHLVPHAKLPPLRDVTLAAKIADTGQRMPAVSTLTLHAGTSDLGSIQPGLTLQKLDVSAPSQDQPMRAEASVTVRQTAATASAILPPLARWMNGTGGPVPIDAAADAAGAHFAAKGSVADPKALTGVAIDLTANIPDLAALSPLAGRPLPSLKTVAFQGKLADMAGSLFKGAALSGLTLASSAGDLKGDVSVGFGTPFTLTAKLRSDRIDADALSGAAGRPLPDASGQPTQTVTPQPPAPPSPRPKEARGDRIFSDRPIPFGLLQLANADVAAQIGDLRAGDRDTKNIDFHLVLQDGRLRVDPLKADLPTGHMEGTLSADASQKAPPVAVVFRAPGIAVRTLLATIGQPDIASGNLEVYADLRGAGESPHAIAASMDGTIGLALANGSIDNRLLGNVVRPLLEKANIPNMLERGGVSDIHCFAAKLDAQHGVGTFRTLALSSSLLTIDGGGTVNFGDETLALHLRPQARVGRTDLIIPLRVTGAIRSPGVAMDPIGAAEANAGTLAGALAGGATPLGLLGSVLGADKLGGGGDACAGPLAVARGQAAPAAPSTPAPASGRQKPPNPATLLRQLFR